MSKPAHQACHSESQDDRGKDDQITKRIHNSWRGPKCLLASGVCADCLRLERRKTSRSEVRDRHLSCLSAEPWGQFRVVFAASFQVMFRPLDEMKSFQQISFLVLFTVALFFWQCSVASAAVNDPVAE